MKLPFTRPENRSRSAAQGSPDSDWPDTEPSCFRSEAFAEDLGLPEAPVLVVRPRAFRHGPARPAAPWLGLRLTAMLGLAGR